MKSAKFAAGGRLVPSGMATGFFLLGFWLAGTKAHADITAATQASAGAAVVFGANSVNATIQPGDALPGYVNVSTYSGQNATFDLSVDIGAGSYSHDSTVPTLTFDVFSFQNASGAVSVANAGDLTWSNAYNEANNVGSGAIQAFGLPGEVSAVSEAYRFGSDVTLANAGNLTVFGIGQSPGGTSLQPDGLRTAGLSGILALSYGAQVLNDTTHPGGNVTVSMSGSTISMAQQNNAIITAGISASSANGPAEASGATYRTRKKKKEKKNSKKINEDG